MLLLQSRKTRRWRRRLLVLLVLAILVAGFAWQGSTPLLQKYQLWKQQKALGRAKAFIAQKDAASAKLEIDIALNAVPGSPEAIRVAADLLQLVGSPQELALRRAIADQAPNSIPDRLALVGTALRLRDYNAARDALATFTAAEAETPAVLRAYLDYALGMDNRPMADALFDRLGAIAPLDDDMRVRHALLLRQHPDPAKAEAARKELEVFAQNPKFSLSLNRAFFAEALASKDFAGAARDAALVCADPAATFDDRLNQASLQLLVEHRPFDAVFAGLAPAASASGPAAVKFIRWLIVQGRAAEAQRWLDGLPAPITRAEEVRAVRMELAAAAKDWDQFGRLLEQGAWGPISPEVARLAMAARLISELKPSLRKPLWEGIMAAAGDHLTTDRVLLRLATTWGWEDETETLLWSVIQLDPAQSWAHAALLRIYRERGDGRKMLEVMTVLKNAAPTSRTYRHDWALLTLLVTPRSEWDAAKVTAREIHFQDPANPNYAATYALALTEAGKTSEALAVLEKLSSVDRDYPPRAPYVAFLYANLRRVADFERYVALATKGPLLNEERQLLARAQEIVTRPLKKTASPVSTPAQAHTLAKPSPDL